jgi:eukaryotic-like serine/threonine-protein kinase
MLDVVGADVGKQVLDDGRFQVRGNLGTGGMGVVYRAYDRRLGREVALKALRHASGRDLYRFKREFRALADIVHPNLVALHELHTQGDEWFFTMELVEGGSFIDRVRPTVVGVSVRRPDEDTRPSSRPRPRSRQDIAVAPLDEGRLAAALPQLVDGVLALHVSGKLHRDLKPSNVLVDGTGRVVLLDFGLVSELDGGSDTDRTHERAAVGTPAYMSPEQAADQPLTEASDWYAVGVMLYEALTGRRPFEGNAEEVMRRKQTEQPPPPHSIVRAVPPALDQLAMALLRRAPGERPDGRAVLAALGAEASVHTRDLERASGRQAFVGRTAELDALRRALAEARRRTVAVFVVGDSGMGKTQLVHRFLADVGDRAMVLEGRCYEREAVPFKMLDTVVDALATGLMRLPAGRLQSVLPRDVAALARLFPVLRRVPAVADRAVGAAVPPDPQELRRRGFGALRFLLGRLAALGPLVICIDDLQWGDADSAVFLADLIHHPEPIPLLVVLVHRPEDGPGVVSQVRDGPAVGRSAGDIRTIEVGPLSTSEAVELITQLGGDPVAASPMVRDAGGHPLFLAELARVATPGEAPPDLDALLGARIAALSPAAGALLRVVAVAARPLALEDAIRAAGGVSGWELGRLRADRLVGVRRVGADEAASLEPYHDRVRDAAMATLDKGARRATHRALAEAIEGRGPEVRDLEGLVDHWLGAGEPARAVDYTERAARAAEEALAFRRAADLYELAVEHGARGEDAVRAIHRRRGEALANAGQLEEAALAFAAAADGADPSEELDLDRLRLEQMLRRGRLDEGLALSRKVLARFGYDLPRSRGAAVRSLVWQRLRLRARGLGFKERREDEVPRAQLQRVDTLFSVSSGLSFVDPLIGKVVQHNFLRAALEVGEPFRVCKALSVEIGYLATAGTRNSRRVEEVSSRAREIAARIGHPYVRGLADATAGLGAFLMGRWPEARADLEAGLKIMRDHGEGVRWEIDISELFLMATLFYRGETRELARMVPLLLREAVERGDLYAQHGLRGWRSNVAWLVMGLPGDARAHVLAVAAERVALDDFNLHNYYEMLSHGQIDLYLGDGEAARARVGAARKALARSHLTRIQTIRIETEFLAARAALVVAVAQDEPATLDEARRCARALEREPVPWAVALARLVRGGIAAVSGDPAAGELLAAAERAFTDADMALFAQVARLRRGELEGGPGGAARAAAARDWMREAAVADPEAMAFMLAPWRV